MSRRGCWAAAVYLVATMDWPVSTKGASPVGKRSVEQIRADRDAKVEALQAQLAEAVGGLVTSADWIAAMEFAARFRSRLFANTMLIRLQHAAAHDAGRVPEPIPDDGGRPQAMEDAGPVGGERPVRLYDPGTGDRPVGGSDSRRPGVVASTARRRETACG